MGGGASRAWATFSQLRLSHFGISLRVLVGEGTLELEL